MAEFANLLRQRLASGAAPWVRTEASHPDADTLTAYVEHLLPAPEREQILEHVVACSHCREVVALAMSLPEPDGLDTAEVVVMAPATPRRRFFSWSPRLGFAASLAIVAVVATVVLVMPKKAPAPVEQAKNDITAPTSVSPAAATQPADAHPPALADSLAANTGRMPTTGSSALRLSARREAPAADRLASASPVNAAGAVAPLAAPNNHLPGITEAYDREAPERRRDYLNNEILATNSTFSVNGQPSDVSVIAAPTSNQDLFQKSLSNAKVPIPFSDLPPPNQDVKTGHISASPSRFGFVIIGSLAHETRQLVHGRTSPPIPPNVSGFAMGVPASQLSPPKGKNQTAEVAAAPAIAEKDASDLDQSSAFTFSRARADASAMKADKRAESSPVSWKTAGGQLLKCGSATACVEGYPNHEGIAFLIVRSHGSEIWAGGNDAALVHSRDGGVTWDRITLGASAKGTITGIDARGPNVQVQSSSGQSWSSQDDGKSWTLQE